MKKQVVPFVVQMYEAMKDLLAVQYIPSSLVPVHADGMPSQVVLKGGLKAEDQGCLYEAISSLIIVMPPEQMRPALQLLLKDPAGNLTDILNAPPAKVASDVRGYASWAGRNIETIANVSKSFSTSQAQTAPDWEAALVVVSRILERFVGQVAQAAGLWRAALFLSRRMVEVLGEQFVGSLAALLPLLYHTHEVADLTELTIFAHHVTAQWQKKA